MADRFDVGSARNVVLGIVRVSRALFVSSRERLTVSEVRNYTWSSKFARTLQNATAACDAARIS